MLEEANEGLATSCHGYDGESELGLECEGDIGCNSFIVVSRTKLF